MEVKIDQYGRILVPKEVRDRLGLVAGRKLELEVGPEGLRLEVAHPETGLKEKDGLLVHTGRSSGDLEGAVQRDRKRRRESLGGS